MGDNSIYYKAERELQRAIMTCPVDVLRHRLVKFVERADTDVNRELFKLFGIEEQKEPNWRMPS